MQPHSQGPLSSYLEVAAGHLSKSNPQRGWAFETPVSTQPRSQGTISSSLEKVPWLRMVTCLCIQIKSAPGWVFDLIVSTLSMEVKVALPYRRYLES